MDTAAELGRNPVSKHQIQPGYVNEQADAGPIRIQFRVNFVSVQRVQFDTPELKLMHLPD